MCPVECRFFPQRVQSSRAQIASLRAVQRAPLKKIHTSGCPQTRFKDYPLALVRFMFPRLVVSVTVVCGQEQGWFDRNDPGTLASRLDSNSSLIRFGVGIKLATVSPALLRLVRPRFVTCPAAAKPGESAIF